MPYIMILSLATNQILQGKSLHPTGDHFKLNLMMVRGLLGVPALTCSVIGAYLLPSQVFIVLNNCNVFFAMLIRCVITKTLPNMKMTGLVFLFLFGVIVMVYPQIFGLTLKSETSKECRNY